MVSLGQGIVDEVTREVSERKDREFAATLERERERIAVRLMAFGVPVHKVAEYLELPLSSVQSLAGGTTCTAVNGSADAKKKYAK